MIVVFEDKQEYIDHDRMFKELIETFFDEFIELFFPEIYKHIDFSYVKFLSQEVFADLIVGEKRRLDLLAETKLRGKDTIVLIHIEPQSSSEKNFPERMFLYYSHIYMKYRKPILPIALFSYNKGKTIANKYNIDFLSENILQFKYFTLHLIKMNWRTYLKSDNPVAAALLSKMGYTEKERVQVKLEFLRMLSRLQLDPAKAALIYGFFETYLRLNEQEELLMQEEIAKLPADEVERVFRLPNSYYEKGLKEGREEGRVEERELIIYGMLQNGLTNTQISNITKLDLSKVEEIVRRLQR